MTTAKTTNRKTKAAIEESRAMGLNSLGKAQASLEAATSELRLAQTAFERAQERLKEAEEQHASANVALMNEVNAIRSNTKVTPLILK